MKAVQTILLVVLAMAAVASAYEPIADSKLPSPKSPVKPEPTLSSRKLLQQAAKTMSGNTMTNTNKPNVLWGGYVITPPYWVAGMGSSDVTMTSSSANPIERRFASLNNK